MLYRLLILCCISINAFQLSAQFTAQSSVGSNSVPFVLGVDFEDSLQIAGRYRNQWTGFEGAPSLYQFCAFAPFGKLVHFSFSYQGRSIGAYKMDIARVSLGKKITAGKGILGLNVSGYYGQNRLNNDILKTPGGQYESGIIHNDDLLGNGFFKAANIDFGVGLNYKIQNYQLGIDVNQLLGSNYQQADGNNFAKNDLNVILILFSEYNLNNNFIFEPFIEVQSNIETFQSKILGTFVYKDLIGAGVGLRGYNTNSLDALITALEVKVGDFEIFYSYDVGLSTLQKFHSGSHEIGIIYEPVVQLLKYKSRNIESHPRF